MITIQDIRSRYPQYDQLSDKDLSDKLYNKYYADKLDRGEFNKKIGLSDAMQPSIQNQNGTLDPIKFNPSFLEKLAPNLAVGALNMGHGLVNAPSNISRSLESFFGSNNTLASKLGIKAKDIPRLPDENYADLLKLPQESTLSDRLIRMLVPTAAMVAMPEAGLGEAGTAIKSIPYVGNILKKVIGNALPIGAFEATQSETPGQSGVEAAKATIPFSALAAVMKSTNPLISLAARLGMGAAGGYTGYEGSKALGATGAEAYPLAILAGGLGLMGKSAKSEARNKILKGVDPTQIKQKLEASNRLGLNYLTPAEASGNPFVAANQGAVGKTEKGSQLLYQRGEDRISSEKKSINTLYDEIYNPDKLDKIKEQLYKTAETKSVPQPFVDSLKDNEIFKTAIKNMESKSAYRESLKGVPENSIKYLDNIKQSLDDMIEGAPKKEARILKETQRKLMTEMDNISPEYKQARQLAERQITRNKIEEKLNEMDVRGTNFYNKILKNDKNFDKLRHSLRNVPNAQQKLDDMRLIFKDLINPPTVRTAAGLAKTSMTKSRSGPQALTDYMEDKIYGGKLDKAAVELMTNPRWEGELNNIKSISNLRERSSKAIELIGKINASLANQNKENQEK